MKSSNSKKKQRARVIDSSSDEEDETDLPAEGEASPVQLQNNNKTANGRNIDSDDTEEEDVSIRPRLPSAAKSKPQDAYDTEEEPNITSPVIDRIVDRHDSGNVSDKVMLSVHSVLFPPAWHFIIES